MDHTTSTGALPPTILVIVGITGDLSKRKLLPALYQITTAKELPDHFHVIGITRRELSINSVLDDTFRDSPNKASVLRPYTEMLQMDLTHKQDYVLLKGKIDSLAEKWGQPVQILFYLSVPPEVSRPIIKLLGDVGLNHEKVKLLLEKPFGTNLASAQEMIEEISGTFKESQMFRIDHYLAKEMAQNILIFRKSNALFRRIWNKDFIEHIEIIASETIGIENRAIFYEQTGALRDIIQSHLMQLLALTLMELPKDDSTDEILEERLRALKTVHIASQASNTAVRAQYEGYREEVANPHSHVETFASLTLMSDAIEWQGVPLTLTTGKALANKFTEIKIYFRRDKADEANRLTLRIQPHEGIDIELWAKQPGYQRKLRSVQLEFAYATNKILPEAYEQVLLDAIRSNKSLFASSEEVLATWRILEPILKIWAINNNDLRFYKKGSRIDSIIKSE